MLSLADKQVSGSSEENGKACVTDFKAASAGPRGPRLSGKKLAFPRETRGRMEGGHFVHGLTELGFLFL